MVNLIFEKRVARVAFPGDRYARATEELNHLANSVGGKVKAVTGMDLALIWTSTETILYDLEDEAAIPDPGYPVLLARVEIVRKKELWPEKTCPYVITIDAYGYVSVYDENHNQIIIGDLRNQNNREDTATIIAKTLNVY